MCLLTGCLRVVRITALKDGLHLLRFADLLDAYRLKKLPCLSLLELALAGRIDRLGNEDFPRKNGHAILGFFGVLSEESGDSVPRTPRDFSLWACTGRDRPLDRPWAGGL